MARRKQSKSVETLTHPVATRKNLPSAEHQPLMQEDDQSPLRLAYERRNRDLDPQLIWRGKDEQDWSDLVVNAPPLYIQERVHPKVLIDDLMRQSEQTRRAQDGHVQPGFADLFADFNGLPSEDAKTEFYQHDANWSNRMILGDSLQVMASLAEREGLRGKVQCIYIDPPYGIKFNSNFQWSTTSRDVKDGKADHITREPEQVKAFRDTWRDGIHSYLTYLRDRLTVARDLLTESGSVFVQIGDENVHRVRALMDEVFGEENFVSQIYFATTSGFSTSEMSRIGDYLIWYARNRDAVKYRTLFVPKGNIGSGMESYRHIAFADGSRRAMTKEEREGSAKIPDGSRNFRYSDLQSKGAASQDTPVEFGKQMYRPLANSHWKANWPNGMERLKTAGRTAIVGKRLCYIRFASDYPVQQMVNSWLDTAFGYAATDKQYVVQTHGKVIQRCILMTTDPGDLVLDPTCGSGTTAYVAEQWGRRWITIDTSRVALALARARIMGARYPFYLLADSRAGQLKEAEIERKAPSESPRYGDIRQGFVYERVPHITLRAIANNAEIDVIWEDFQQRLEPLRESLNAALGTKWEEWQIPREADEGWPPDVKKLHELWWQQRIARQQEVDASIAAKADYEYLYDKPYEDRNKVRVAGPFTVESISPHRVLAVDENDDFIDTFGEGQAGYGSVYDFAAIILENLKSAGVQQAHKEDRITFTSLTPWPGHHVCAEGRYYEGGEEDGIQRRAAIFIGPEFGTVSRPDLVAAAREAADGAFDVLIACAFNYEAHTTEFERLGSVPVLKARMNADLHMAADLKNTGKGNLFVIFGEPDISVASGQWLVANNGSKVANYEHVKELSGLASLEEINRVGKDGLSTLCSISAGGKVRHDQSDPAGSGEHRGGLRTSRDQGISSVLGGGERLAGGDGDLSDPGAGVGDGDARTDQTLALKSGGGWTDAQRTQTLAALQKLSDADFPLSLTTDHWSQVTVHGVDVFHPNTGKVQSDGPEGIACWFIDTDYNEENFFVRHAYFLGANDPYKALKTTLKAQIDADAWASLNSDTSRPFEKPASGRIAVKVINHLGDEVMKIFRVP